MLHRFGLTPKCGSFKRVCAAILAKAAFSTHLSTGRKPVADHVYKVVELVGSSKKSVSAAIENAVAKAAKTIRNLGWFELVEVRGHVDGGKIQHYQATIKAGFTLED